MNDNKVELLGFYGSDNVIACSAWTSTSRDLTEEKLNRVDKLINMLWSEGHHSVFEKGMVHFLVDTEIASHIHFLKHRMSSFNGESARYKELKEDKFYIPEDWDVLTKGRDTNTWQDNLVNFTHMSNIMYHRALEELTPVLGRARAKESARFFKTYNSQIQGDVSFNMRSFANFLKLRYRDPRGDNKIHAQKEIADIAKQMLDLVKGIEGNPFEHTIKAWGY